MAKIIQIAAYNKNIGDSIIVDNIRKCLPGHTWTNLDFNSSYNVKQINHHDMLIVGGGGLIDESKKNKSRWKLDLHKENLKQITIPIVVVGIGVNYFRGMPTINTEGWKNILALKKQSALFSVRNDGSSKYFEDVREIPDAGLVQLEKIDNVSKICRGFLNPAMNSSGKIMEGRKIKVKEIQDIAKKYNLDIMPHTPKDYRVKGYYAIEHDKLIHNLSHGKLLHNYDRYDFSVAMRGHGQLVSYSRNIPCISLCTQDKLSNFCAKHGFENYMVDTNISTWKYQLDWKIALMKKKWIYYDFWILKRYQKMKQWITIFKDYMNEVSCLLD